MNEKQYCPVDESHACELLNIWSDADVIRYTNMQLPCTMEDVRSRIDRYRKYDVFAVIEQGELIGIVGCPPIDPAKSEFGLFYQFSKDSWGQGHATAAAMWQIEFMRKKYGSFKLYADVIVDNAASEKILQKIGFTMVAEETIEREGQQLKVHKYEYVEDLLITAGYCGLACKACSVYIASLEGGEALEQRAKKAGKTADEMFCKGCRSDKTSPYCTACEMKKCIRARGLNWCSQCQEYPCRLLKDFQKSMPHRAEVLTSLEYAREHSTLEWDQMMQQNFTCEKCGTYNSVYSDGCRICKNDYPNPFAMRHKNIIS